MLKMTLQRGVKDQGMVVSAELLKTCNQKMTNENFFENYRKKKQKGKIFAKKRQKNQIKKYLLKKAVL